jgi:hypothetical protein
VRRKPAAFRCRCRAGFRLSATLRGVPIRGKGALRALWEGYAISRIELRTEAEVSGVDEGLFLEKNEATKRDCAVSKALAGVEEIALEAKLLEHTG